MVLILAVEFGAFYALVAPPGQHDLLDRLWAGDAGSRRVAHDVAYGGARRQGLDIYDKAQVAGHPKPVLVFFYWGGWHGGDKDHYGFVARAYAAKRLPRHTARSSLGSGRAFSDLRPGQRRRDRLGLA